MAVLVYASFTGTDGVDVSAYTPDTTPGGGFSDTGANTAEISSNQVKFSAASTGFWIDSGVTDQYIYANWNSGGADNRCGVDARRDSAAFASRTCYEANFRPGTDEIYINKISAGTITQLGAVISYAFDVSTTYKLGIRVTGTTIEALVDDVVVGTRTDSSITTGSYGGFCHFLRTTGNGRVDEFYIESVPTYTLTAAQGSYALTGQASALTAARKLTAAQGSYALTGYDATLTYTPVSGATYTLTAAQGSYGLTGSNAALTAARKLTADQGSYTLTGYDASLIYTHLPNYTLTAASASYTLTGNDSALVASRALTAEHGAYTYTGFSATLTSSADAQQSAVEQVAGGWWNSYNSEMQRREAAKAKKKKLKEELEKIEDKLDKEIILELSKKEKEKERIEELKRLSKLAQEHKREISQIMDDRIVMAVDRAITVRSYSAMEQMEREISKAKEEMEFLSMATEILINQYYLN